ncbi:MAG TPA: hypothetical protein VFA05_06785 [Gaiellaceae bacterium]|nr:hypothetical protein [Gaiellaceae bacterium]
MRISSPRARRRLIWAAAAAALAGGTAAVFLLVPSSGPSNPAPTVNEGPAQVVSNVHERLTAADRRSIDATLDRFIPAGVGRRSMTTAWRFAGPELKASSTLAQWRAGSSPIPSYPVGGTTFHNWTPIDVGRGEVEFNLLVHPRPGAKLGSWVFSGQVVRRGSRWLVNRLYTIAIMNPVRGSQHEIGPADFGAAASQAPPAPTKAPLGKGWLLVVIGAVGLALLIPVAFGIVSLARARRWRRLNAERASRPLPPLPSDPATPRPAREREPAGTRRD